MEGLCVTRLVYIHGNMYKYILGLLGVDIITPRVITYWENKENIWFPMFYYFGKYIFQMSIFMSEFVILCHLSILAFHPDSHPSIYQHIIIIKSYMKETCIAVPSSAVSPAGDWREGAGDSCKKMGVCLRMSAQWYVSHNNPPCALIAWQTLVKQ